MSEMTAWFADTFLVAAVLLVLLVLLVLFVWETFAVSICSSNMNRAISSSLMVLLVEEDEFILFGCVSKEVGFVELSFLESEFVSSRCLLIVSAAWSTFPFA